jgi:hypothetical protein
MAIDHPRDALPTGYRLGSYEVLRLLGRGGSVWKTKLKNLHCRTSHCGPTRP